MNPNKPNNGSSGIIIKLIFLKYLWINLMSFYSTGVSGKKNQKKGKKKYIFNYEESTTKASWIILMCLISQRFYWAYNIAEIILILYHTVKVYKKFEKDKKYIGIYLCKVFLTSYLCSVV